MNEIVHRFLLTEDKFMPKMHLRKPVFASSASGAFVKNKKKIKETVDSRYFYQNKLEKFCF